MSCKISLKSFRSYDVFITITVIISTSAYHILQVYFCNPISLPFLELTTEVVDKAFITNNIGWKLSEESKAAQQRFC